MAIARREQRLDTGRDDLIATLETRCRELGFDLFQGYFFARPGPADDCTVRLTAAAAVPAQAGVPALERLSDVAAR